MAILKCKMCGGDLEASEGQKIVECEFCGSKQTIVDPNNEKKVNLSNRANRLRISCDFDKAASIYEQIIAEFPEEAEAYWGLCLCNYGIEYVDDPLTANKIPTCHRASFDKLRKDENYELALENADMEQRIIFEDQAKEIDRIMGEILAISRDEEPYDIFICYKETDNVGSRTHDSVLAQDIYDALIQKGYRVFFSRITLEDKLGTMYEPYIFSALNSAKVMLVVGTDYEYMNAVWVRNEWSRFLKIMAKDKSKVLIPCYKDMDPYDMPDEFKGFQSQDCSKIGFMQDLTRGINKLLGKVELDSTTVILQGANNGSNSGTEVLIKRAFMFLEDGDWENADEYSEKVLDKDPESAQAYLCKLLASKRRNTIEGLVNLDYSFSNDKNYQKIVRFGDDELKRELEQCLSNLDKRLAEKEKEIDELVKRDELGSKLYEAVKNDDIKLVKALIEEGADVQYSKCDDYCWKSILIEAICKSNVDMVKLLLLNGANPNCGRSFFKSSDTYRKDTHLSTLFDSIIEWPNDEIAILLINAGANVNYINRVVTSKVDYCVPLLTFAICIGNVNIVKLLLEKGADPNCERVFANGTRFSALRDSIIQWPNNNIVELLVSYNANCRPGELNSHKMRKAGLSASTQEKLTGMGIKFHLF